MDKSTIVVETREHNGIIQNINRSVLVQPVPMMKEDSVKWFDDTKLIKKTR